MVVEGPRLARPRGDVNKWGAIVNKFLRVAHNEDGTLKIEAMLDVSIGTGLLLDGTVLKVSLVLQKYHAIDPSDDIQTLLGADDLAAIKTFLGIGDSQTFVNLTLTGDIAVAGTGKFKRILAGGVDS